MTLEERKTHRAIQRMAQKRATRMGLRFSELSPELKRTIYEYCKAKRDLNVITRWF